MKIAKKWKWAMKSRSRFMMVSVKKPILRSYNWETNGEWMYSQKLLAKVPGPWRKSLHKRVGDEWVRVDD